MPSLPLPPGVDPGISPEIQPPKKGGQVNLDSDGCRIMLPDGTLGMRKTDDDEDCCCETGPFPCPNFDCDHCTGLPDRFAATVTGIDMSVLAWTGSQQSICKVPSEITTLSGMKQDGITGCMYMGGATVTQHPLEDCGEAIISSGN